MALMELVAESILTNILLIYLTILTTYYTGKSFHVDYFTLFNITPFPFTTPRFLRTRLVAKKNCWSESFFERAFFFEQKPQELLGAFTADRAFCLPLQGYFCADKSTTPRRRIMYFDTLCARKYNTNESPFPFIHTPFPAFLHPCSLIIPSDGGVDSV